MFAKWRAVHRWVGLLNAVFLLLIAVTGFLLATKSRVSWVRPAEQRGAEVASMSEVISVDEALKSAFAEGIPELKEKKQVDRVDYRPGRNVFKILSKEGYHEVQVCGATGTVLQVAKRTDQFVEDLHDLSFFSDNLRDFLLPLVGISLFALSGTGIYIFMNPVIRRWKFKRKQAKNVLP
jgi:uncharacterized iron-regulated membrane protein